MLNMRDFRSKAKGLPDLLPYAALVAPGVMLQKDGSFLVMFVARGHDTFSATDGELAYVSAQFNNAVRLLGSGWMLHVDAVRSAEKAYPAKDQCFFQDRVTQKIDDMRRAFFGQEMCFKTLTRISITYKPDYGAAKLANKAQGLHSHVGLEKHLQSFLHSINELEDALSSVLSLRRLTEYDLEDGRQGSDFLSALKETISGDTHPVLVPTVPMYADCLLGCDDLVGGLAPRLGTKHIRVLSIDGLPQESWPAMLSALDNLPFAFRYNTRFICLDQHEAQKEINDYVKGWNQKIYSFLDQYLDKADAKADRDALVMREDAEEAKADVMGGYTGAGYLSSTIVLMHEDKELLDNQIRELRKIVQTLGFGCRIESLNALDAWLGSLPGVSYANVRKPLVTTLNLADLLPLSSVWTGSPVNPCPFYPKNSRPLMVATRDGSTPMWLNFHVGDVGHTLIFGPTGAGKSTFLSTVTAQFLGYKKATVFAFDKGMSLYPLCQGAGGKHYTLGAKGGLAFAPLQNIDADAAEMTFAEEWIASLVTLQGIHIMPKHQDAIHKAMLLLAEQPRHLRSLTDFRHIVGNAEIKEALLHYTVEGAAGYLLDAQEDSLELSRFTVFEMDEIMSQGDKNLLPVLAYLFHKIQKALKGQPAIILFDEAWAMLEHEEFKKGMRAWLKTFRKFNCMMVMATQSLSDAKRSGILDVLVESCLTKVFLANPSVHQEDQRALYTDMGLNTRQLEIISNMQMKREYYLVQPQGSCRLQLNLSPYELAYVGSSDKESIARIDYLQKTYPQNWQEYWEEEKCA